LDQHKQEMKGLDVSVVALKTIMEEQVSHCLRDLRGTTANIGTFYWDSGVFARWCCCCVDCGDVGTWMGANFVSYD
jgi:hypothetical protein